MVVRLFEEPLRGAAFPQVPSLTAFALVAWG